MNAKLAQLIHEYRERYHDLSLKTCPQRSTTSIASPSFRMNTCSEKPPSFCTGPPVRAVFLPSTFASIQKFLNSITPSRGICVFTKIDVYRRKT